MAFLQGFYTTEKLWPNWRTGDFINNYVESLNRFPNITFVVVPMGIKVVYDSSLADLSEGLPLYGI